MDVPTLAELLRETAERHDRYERTHAEHHWWDWYAPYLSARQQGSSSEEASDAADRYMEESRAITTTRYGVLQESEPVSPGPAFEDGS